MCLHIVWYLLNSIFLLFYTFLLLLFFQETWRIGLLLFYLSCSQCLYIYKYLSMHNIATLVGKPFQPKFQTWFPTSESDTALQQQQEKEQTM